MDVPPLPLNNIQSVFIVGHYLARNVGNDRSEHNHHNTEYRYNTNPPLCGNLKLGHALLLRNPLQLSSRLCHSSDG
jgi:hypothetical protein